MTVLMDKEIMQRNIHALGLQSLSSIDIIKRLRYHISSVRDVFVFVWCVCVCVCVRERESVCSMYFFNSIQLQCNLYGHYSLDGSLSLLVLPTLNSSLDLLVSYTYRSKIAEILLLGGGSDITLCVWGGGEGRGSRISKA